MEVALQIAILRIAVCTYVDNAEPPGQIGQAVLRENCRLHVHAWAT